MHSINTKYKNGICFGTSILKVSYSVKIVALNMNMFDSVDEALKLVIISIVGVYGRCWKSMKVDGWVS